MEFNELNVEYGYIYESPAIVPDGTPAPHSADEVRVYEPSTRPGSPLPHAWLEDDEGNRVPIKDLVRPGRFLLIAGEDGEAWCEAARSLAEAHSVPLDAVRIGHLDGDWYDPRCTWLRQRAIGPEGAILVRPDRFVAWRNSEASADPQAELACALGQVVSRTIQKPQPSPVS
jgi:2,4-dichlorophenol 6-monooxygenase